MDENKELDNQERLTRLETQMENLTKMLSSISEKLDVWNLNYVPRSEINEMFKSRDRSINEIENRLNKHVDDSNNEKGFINSLPNWGGLIFGFIMLLIAIYALNR